MPVKWGIGIEHETLISFPDEDQEVVNGKYILEMLLENSNGLNKFMKDIIIKNKKYRLYRVYNHSDFYLDSVASYSLDIFKDFLDQKGNKDLLHAYLDLIKSMSPNLVLHDWKNYMDPGSGRSYFYNQITGESIFDDIMIYTNKELDLREALNQIIIPSIHDDSTNTYGVSEFTTPSSHALFRNNKVYQVVAEIVLKQEIIKRILETQSSFRLEYPKIGTVFPIMVEDSGIIDQRGITIDYSGSYHLNLSLPYDEYLLERERLKYEKYRNKIEQLVKPVDTRIMSITSEEYETKVKEIENNILKYIEDSGLPKDARLNKVLSTANSNISILNNIILGSFPYKRICIKVGGHPSNLSISIYLIFDGVMVYLLSYHFPHEIYLGNELLPMEDETMRDYFQKIVDNKTYSPLKHNYLFNSPTELLAIPNDYGADHDGINPKLSYSEINKLRDVFKNNKIDMTENLNTGLIDYIKKSILDMFYYRVYYDIYMDLNLYNNAYFIDEVSNFHKIHKVWAVCIQWIMPLILSAFSSCDPLSVGEGNKLTELSLRSFISGYSFIDITDILNYGLPVNRTVYSYQEESSLIPILKKKYPYWDSNSKIKGSEFRSDPMRGFDFGFELRIFDNFESEHLNKLIELLVLLADHIHRSGIGENIENPFNNNILDNFVEKVVAKGWLTEIEKEYIELLNKNLKLNLKYSEGLTSYDLINEIYFNLISDAIKNQSSNIYSKHMISDDLISHFRYYFKNGKLDQNARLPNINRLSWEKSFNELIYIPNKWNIRKETSGINSGDLRLKLDKILPTGYKSNIDDIYYFLLESV